MDVFDLAAKISLDTSAYESGLAGVKKSLGGFGGMFDKASGLSQKSLQSIATKAQIVGNTVTGIFNKVTGVIGGSMDKAISRVDTLNSYSKVMTSLGYSSEKASKQVQTLSDGIQGLPTTLPDIVSMQQQFSALLGDMDSATDLTLALNDAVVAGGASTEVASSALNQWYQMISNGKPDLQSWRIVNSAMPAQMKAIAQETLGASASTQDLYNAWQKGTISTEYVQKAIERLDKEGGKGMQSFHDQAQSAAGGIATSMQNVQTKIATVTANVIQAAQDMDSQGKARGLDIAGILDNLKVNIGDLGNVFVDVAKKIDWQTINTNINSLVNGVFKLAESVDWQGLVNGLVNGANQLVGALNSVFDIVEKIKSGGDISSDVDSIVNTVTNLATSIVDKVSKAIPAVITIATELITSFIQAIADNTPQLLDSAAEIVTTIGQGIIDNLPLIVNAVVEFLRTFTDYITEHKDEIQSGIQALVDALVQGIITLTPELADAALAIVTALGGALIDSVPQIVEQLPVFVSEIFSAITDAWNEASPSEKVALAAVLAPIITGGIGDAINAVKTGKDIVGKGGDILSKIFEKVDEIIDLSDLDIGEDKIGAIDKLKTALGGLKDGLAGLGGKTLDGLKGLGGLLGNLATTVGSGVLTGIQSFGGFLTGTLAPGIAGLATTLAPFLPLILGISAAIIGVILVVKNWDKISKGLKEGWDKLKEGAGKVWGGIKDTISGAWDKVKSKTSEIWGNIKDSVSEKWDGLKEKAGSIFGGIKDKVSGAWDKIKEKTGTVWGNIKDGVASKWDGIKEKAGSVFGKVKDTVGGAWDKIKENTSSKWSAIKDTVDKNGGGIKGTIKTAAKGYLKPWKDGFEAMNKASNGKLGDAVNGVKKNLALMKAKFTANNAAMKTIAKGLVKKVKEGWSGIKSTGGDFVKGLWSGINNKVSWIVDKVKGFGKKVLKGLKDFFKIKSPSRVMRDEIGVNLALGVAKGIEKGTPKATKASDKLADSILKSVSKVKTVTVKVKTKTASTKKATTSTKSSSSSGVMSDDEYLKMREQIWAKNLTGTSTDSTKTTKKSSGRSKSSYKKSVALSQKEIDDAYIKAVEKRVSELTKAGKLTDKEQANLWVSVSKRVKKGSNAYGVAMQKIKASSADARKSLLESFQKVEQNYAALHKGRELNEAEEVAYWKKVRGYFKKGTDEWIQAQSNYLSHKKQLQEQEKQANETLKSSLQSAEQTYQQALQATIDKVNQRKQTLLSSFQLFEKYDIGTGISKSKLMENLQSQLDALEDWREQVADLGKRIGGTKLFDEIREMGVQGYQQVVALNTMTNEELKQYADTYHQRNVIAGEQAKEELAPTVQKESEAALKDYMKNVSDAWGTYKTTMDDMGIKVTGLTKSINDSVEKAGTKYTKVLDKMNLTTQDKTAAITSVLTAGISKTSKKTKKYGADLVQNFIDGIQSKEKDLTDAVQKSIAKVVKKNVGFSEPEEGPLADFHTYAPDMIDLFTKGIKDNGYKIGEAFDQSLGLSDLSSRIGAEIFTPAVQAAGNSLQIAGLPNLTEIAGQNNNSGNQPTNLHVTLKVGRTEFAKLVYQLGKEEEQRVGLNLATGAI